MQSTSKMSRTQNKTESAFMMNLDVKSCQVKRDRSNQVN